MVVHEADSLPELISGHRIIVYYIEGDTTSNVKLCSSVESVVEMLEKKNDDLIIFKVYQNTSLFSQFKELYKPQISGPLALFVINNEGIPLICEHINEEHDIPHVIESICTYCKLSVVSKIEIDKIIKGGSRKTHIKHTGSLTNELQGCSQELLKTCIKTDILTPGLGIDNKTVQPVQSSTTELQIRLPDGSKDKQKFDKVSLLHEVSDFIRTNFGLTDFELKTYNRNIFSETDYEKTLEDLDLAPNGVIYVVYKNVVSNRNNGISSLMQYGFQVFVAKTSSVFLYIQGMFFAFWNIFFPSSSNSTRQIQNKSEGNSSAGQKSISNGVRRSGSKRFGNIHTLQRNDDSDDENNRYNGNSTQQK